LLLVLIAQGLKLPDIADRLAVPPKTVGVYRARLLEKLKLSGNAEVAHYAATHGLVPAG
jgi:two-component system invasion response regulator UvrY